MNIFFSALLVLLLFTISTSAQEIKLNETFVVLGNDTIVVQKYQTHPDTAGYCFVHVHENEVASLEAGFRMLLKNGGTLVTLRHSDPGTVNRNIQFTLQNETYEFDPNRIFTNDTMVLNKTLSGKTTNATTRDSALQLVQQLAKVILDQLSGYHTWVALHNNKNTPAKWSVIGKNVDFEPESYSIVSYIKKFDESSESSLSASDLYINPSINNSEFFIVTRASDFEAIRQKRYNVVLQNDKPVNDGSLSVFAFNQKVRYINAEAKQGRVEEQTEMLEIWQAVFNQSLF